MLQLRGRAVQGRAGTHQGQVRVRVRRAGESRFAGPTGNSARSGWVNEELPLPTRRRPAVGTAAHEGASRRRAAPRSQPGTASRWLNCRGILEHRWDKRSNVFMCMRGHIRFGCAPRLCHIHEVAVLLRLRCPEPEA
jgi:hypothetical protein